MDKLTIPNWIKILSFIDKKSKDKDCKDIINISYLHKELNITYAHVSIVIKILINMGIISLKSHNNKTNCIIINEDCSDLIKACSYINDMINR